MKKKSITSILLINLTLLSFNTFANNDKNDLDYDLLISNLETCNDYKINIKNENDMDIELSFSKENEFCIYKMHNISSKYVLKCKLTDELLLPTHKFYSDLLASHKSSLLLKDDEIEEEKTTSFYFNYTTYNNPFEYFLKFNICTIESD